LQPTPPSLVAPFVAAAPPALRRVLTSMPALERRLWSFVSEGRAAWPELRLEPTTFIAFVGKRLQHDPGEGDSDVVDAEDALEGLRPADLYLACACACGDASAVALFDARYMNEVVIALSRMRLSAAQVDEVKQLVRQRLFVAAASEPGKIAEYSGRGDLRRWVRTVALRTCLNLLRKGKAEVLVGDDQVLANLAVAGDDPELAYMKQRYRGDFKQAFVDTLAALSARDQTLLRYHHVDSLNIDEIGAIYRVHRVTAYRWLEKAREALVIGIQQRLKERLRLDQGELDSVLRLIRSQLHLSLVRHLGDGGSGEEEIVELDPADVEALDEADDADEERGG
jgi:RNA polymerase sigma-70 factor, ECF subfamily